jgi:hypothetical protein
VCAFNQIQGDAARDSVTVTNKHHVCYEIAKTHFGDIPYRKMFDAFNVFCGLLQLIATQLSASKLKISPRHVMQRTTIWGFLLNSA